MNIIEKYYDSKDKYSDGEIENTIIDLIKENKEEYENAFKKNDSWPVIYHLSESRKNIINWYPFKKSDSILEVGAGMGAITEQLCEMCGSVTSVELSKVRASAIIERNSKRDNLDLYIGNFNKIKFDKKFDYILLNGVFEYGALYLNTDNPYIDFLNKLKGLLKPNGKILIAIENRFGLKYWCGAREDHTSIMYDGINGYPSNLNIKTFSKNELEEIFSKCKLNSKFYYVFPDYKFPELILTDDSVNSNISKKYIPYYFSKMKLLVNEHLVFKDIEKNNEIPFFANSFFIELSNYNIDSNIKYVKFNNYRKSNYRLITIEKDNKFYKIPAHNSAKDHLNNIFDYSEILDSMKVSNLKVKRENELIYTNKVNINTLNNIIDKLALDNNYKEIEKIYNKIEKIIKKTLGEKTNSDSNIFEKYGLLTKNKNYNFYKNGFIDIIPDNIMNDDEYTLIDQEWYEENVPFEYIMFRSIYYCLSLEKNGYDQLLYNKYSIDKELFMKLDDKVMDSIHSEYEKYFINFYNNSDMIWNFDLYIDSYNEEVLKRDDANRRLNAEITPLREELNLLREEQKRLIDHINNVNKLNKKQEKMLRNNEKEVKNLNEQCFLLQNELNTIYNSRRWKILNKISKIFRRK